MAAVFHERQDKEMRKKEEERCKKEIKKRQKTEGENLEEKE